MRRLCRETGRRLRYFVVRAGKVIVPVCVLLGGLNALSLNGVWGGSEVSGDSLLSWIGRGLTPLFSPMGIREENWPATVGLLTGMLAKEVVVGTLNTLYMQAEHLARLAPEQLDILGLLGEAVYSIPQNLLELARVFIHPLSAPADSEMSQSVYGVMGQYFEGKAGAYAYLLFILLYVPCVSTMAAIRQEAGKKLMRFSVAWSSLLAYVIAVMFYQLATVFEHPQQTCFWVLCLAGVVVVAVFWMKQSTYLQSRGHRVITTS